MINNSHTVNEDLRIRFTKQLNRLREEDVNEVVFPTTLTNIERKFLHALAEELGLKSQSIGKGEDRCITVTKNIKDVLIENETIETNNKSTIPLFSLNSKTKGLLSKHFNNSSSSSPSSPSNINNKTDLSIKNNNFSVKISKLSDDLNSIKKSYQKAQLYRMNSSNYVLLQKSRETLPAFTHKKDVCELIKKHQIILVSGETGCGKSTQVPQFLLDDVTIGSTCRIAITQPRRLSAMSVSERIACERGEPIGSTVGYNIRLESERSKATQLLFVTPGVLLRKLQSDALLEEYSHIIIDEAHERDRFTEFLLIIVRDICIKRPSLKVILMSATMQTKKLSSYFGNVPHISMGGSVFPVQEFYLEHILRFTDFVKEDKGDNSCNIPIASDASSALIQLNQSFVCSICQQGQFKTPVSIIIILFFRCYLLLYIIIYNRKNWVNISLCVLFHLHPLQFITNHLIQKIHLLI
jgi:HrpA-like RNA helicase